jgi:enolase
MTSPRSNDYAKITQVHARELLDSRGFPTVEVELWVEDSRHAGEQVMGSAIVPSGASTGEGEALELRDGDPKRFLGKGVQNAVANINQKIAPAIVGKRFSTQRDLDDLLNQLDGTTNKANLGANAILGVSMAHLRAQSATLELSTSQLLYREYGGVPTSPASPEEGGLTLPVPLMNILNGGKHADNGLAIQEFMIVPHGFTSFKEALRAGTEVFHQLKKILHDQGLSTSVGDEGGFAPLLPGARGHERAIELILQAVQKAGYSAGKQISLALDAAASEFIDKEGNYLFEGQKLSSQKMVEQYAAWVDRYPILSIEDGLAEQDWTGWKALTERLGDRCQLVGDDLFVTNLTYLRKGIEQKTANAILIKLNQIGTVTETLLTMRLAAQARYACITSHRSGETEDTFIAELAVGTDCGQIKTGSASRTDRIAKYNQLLRIEERLGGRAKYLGSRAFRLLK